MSVAKLKVAHIVYSLSIGGVTNIVERLLRDKKEWQDLVLIVLADPDAGLSESYSCSRFNLKASIPDVYTLKGFLSIYFNPKKYFSAIVDDLVAIVETEKINVFHFHGLPKDLPIGSLLQQRVRDLKLVYTDHLMRIAEKEYSWLTIKILSRIYRKFYKPYHVIFVSKAIANRAEELHIVNKRKYAEVIENTVDLSRITQKTDYNCKGLFRIVYVSRISKVKGHFLLPEVAKILISKYQTTDFCFHLIGPGELTESLQEQINNMELGNKFLLEGPRSNVQEILAGYDMAVFPSEKEGLPVALLEKMAAGMPVVASDIPEIKNVIQDPEEALLFPVNNAAACAAQLYRLMQDQQLRNRIGTTGRKAVENRYAASLADRYAAFYKKIFE